MFSGAKKFLIATGIPVAALFIFAAFTFGAAQIGQASDLLVTLKSAAQCADQFCGLSIF